MDPTLLVIQDAIFALASLEDPQQYTVKENFTMIIKILFSKSTVNPDDPSPEALVLLKDILQTSFFLTIINRLPYLQIEQRNQFTFIFNAAISIKEGRIYPVVIWINNNINILDKLISFYGWEVLAITSGTILRLCSRHPTLALQLLIPNRLEKLIPFFKVAEFDVSSDSFATFRELVLRSPISKDWLTINTQYLIDLLHSTLNDENYSVTIQSLKLFGELMENFDFFRDAYLTNEKNLVILMKIMASKYNNISIESYHIFKMFVAFEPKPQKITRILKQNSHTLINFLKGILSDLEDEESQQERDYILMSLSVI